MGILKLLLEQEGVDYIERTFRSSDGPAGLGPDPFVSGNTFFTLFLFKAECYQYMHGKWCTSTAVIIMLQMRNQNEVTYSYRLCVDSASVLYH